MQHALYVPPFGTFGDVIAVDLAGEAEQAAGTASSSGTICSTRTTCRSSTPWIALAAIAAATERIRLGPLITPLPRRRPWKVARESVTLDHLSAGRLVLGVGLGIDFWREFGGFGGEAADDRGTGRAARRRHRDHHATVVGRTRDATTGRGSRVDGVRFLPEAVAGTRASRSGRRCSGRRGRTRCAAPRAATASCRSGPTARSHPTTCASCAPPSTRARRRHAVRRLPARSAASRPPTSRRPGVTWFMESFFPDEPLAEVRQHHRRGPARTA